MGGASTVCQGGTGPQTEDCNGLDDNCNGIVDDVPGAGLLPHRLSGLHLQHRPPAASTAGGSASPGTADLHHGALGQQLVRRGHHPHPRGPLRHAGQQLRRRSPTRTTPRPATSVTRRASPAAPPAAPPSPAWASASPASGSATPPPGRSAASNAVTPTAEVCDGKDNDCNGIIDEGFDVGAACDNGVHGRLPQDWASRCATRWAPGTICNAGSTTRRRRGVRRRRQRLRRA